MLQHPRWSNNLSTGLVRTRVRVDPFPSAGYQFRVGSDVATPFIGSEDRYLRFLGDGSVYRQLRRNWIVQFRLMAGTFVNGVLDSDRGFIPPQKLFYGGGPTTVHGFRRNGPGDDNGRNTFGTHLPRTGPAAAQRFVQLDAIAIDDDRRLDRLRLQEIVRERSTAQPDREADQNCGDDEEKSKTPSG